MNLLRQLTLAAAIALGGTGTLAGIARADEVWHHDPDGGYTRTWWPSYGWFDHWWGPYGGPWNRFDDHHGDWRDQKYAWEEHDGIRGDAARFHGRLCHDGIRGDAPRGC